MKIILCLEEGNGTEWGLITDSVRVGKLTSHKNRKYLEFKVGLCIDCYEMPYRPRNSTNLSVD
jgi:hypothetical protein